MARVLLERPAREGVADGEDGEEQPDAHARDELVSRVVAVGEGGGGGSEARAAHIGVRSRLGPGRRDEQLQLRPGPAAGWGGGVGSGPARRFWEPGALPPYVAANGGT
ncbi:MAG: hypothetical protein SGPRY_007344, partial [Prymnesium sp.]